MVHIYRGDLLLKLYGQQPGKRMPLLCCVNRSFGWRILSENYEDHPKGIRSQIHDLNDTKQECYLTSMATSEKEGIIAIGSGYKDGKLFFIKDLSFEKDVESGPRFKPIHTELIGAPIHSLDWSGKHLLVGLNHGLTKLLKVGYKEEENEYSLDIKCIGQYINSPSEISVHAPSAIINTHVKSAQFVPDYFSDTVDNARNISSNIKNQFLTTTRNRISIWDALHTSAPVQYYEADKCILNCANWSPNHPHYLIVSGGTDQGLMIHDTRMGDVVWKVEHAHDRPVRDVKFNPFIPYWLASAGEDAIVNIWDIRFSYHAPVAKIDGHLGTVTSITWSNIRPENIGTTSTDGVMRYWTLSPEGFPLWDTFYRISNFSVNDTLPITRKSEENNIWCVKNQMSVTADDDTLPGDEEEHLKSTMLLAGAFGLGEWGRSEAGTIYKGEDRRVDSKGAVVMIQPSKARPSMYYTITSGGQFGAHIIRFDASNNLRYRHRYDPEDKNELAAQIEDDIYCRRITEAHHKLDLLKSQGSAEEAAFLQDCLRIHGPIRETDWSFDSLPDRSSRRVSCRLWNHQDIWEMAIQTFKTDLKYWNYRIPPGYNTGYKFPLEIEPIIAPHLLEEEVILTEIPPFKNDSDSSVLLNSGIDDSSHHPAYVGANMNNENDHYSFILEDDELQQQRHKGMDEMMKAKPPPLLKRRNASHESPITHVSTVVAIHDLVQPSKSMNPFAQQVSPFKKDEVVATPFDAPHSSTANPFEVHKEHIVLPRDVNNSENSFDSITYHTIQSNTQDYNQQRKKDKRHSWISQQAKRFSLSSLSAVHIEQQQEPPKPERYNPFKRYLHSSSTDEIDVNPPRLDKTQTRRRAKTTTEERPRGLTKLNRETSSSRRNALHGPY